MKRGNKPSGRGIASADGVALDLKINPFLHVDAHQIYNPHTDSALKPDDRGFRELHQIYDDESAPCSPPDKLRSLLEEGEWLINADADLSHRFHIKYVSLESHTVCNQACYFCPVSISRRDPYFMPTELYESIVGQLAKYRDTIEAFSMIQYNEPTVDKRFLDQIRLLKNHGLPPALLTNATGLTPKRVDAIMEMGGLSHLSINLSTIDPERYAKERGGSHVELVLRYVSYMKDLEIAPNMEIQVLGTGDDNHRRDFQEISAEFAGSRFEVKYSEIMDRAGNLPVGQRPNRQGNRLCGCDQTGSRPIQWLHVTPQGKCVLCCQDYYEDYIVGDLNKETVEEVLGGEKMARYRRWLHGIEESPKDFICRKCIYARTR